jgi:hypothetical protein
VNSLEAGSIQSSNAWLPWLLLCVAIWSTCLSALIFSRVNFVRRFCDYVGEGKLGVWSRARSLQQFRIGLGVFFAIVAILCLIGALTLN